MTASTATVLFDLDGTLVDTAPELGEALNRLRERHGLPVLPPATIRPHASHGTRGLLLVGFGLTPEDASFAGLRAEYLVLYDAVLTQSRPFEGIPELLERLQAQGIIWGVVTNKPRRFTLPLLAALPFSRHAACVVSGDDVVRSKPHPDSLLRACELAHQVPASCWYVGDAERDIEAAQAAGMRTVVARYGYLDVSERPDTWGADALIDVPADLERVLGLG